MSGGVWWCLVVPHGFRSMSVVPEACLLVSGACLLVSGGVWYMSGGVWCMFGSVWCMFGSVGWCMSGVVRKTTLFGPNVF